MSETHKGTGAGSTTNHGLTFENKMDFSSF